MCQRPVFDVKVVQALPKYLSLVIGFNSETQPGVQSPEALF
jgi:hypothetical protein